MFKRKVLSYFQHDMDKIIVETEEKTEGKFHKGENDARLPNLKLCNF